ncbi:MAG: endonuclease/exonuclease/phosphatase family protein, partial [Clostridia bacterium]|nr:endonuclease/exonuclease/phosphatase family protein [Clostridia bacterium]
TFFKCIKYDGGEYGTAILSKYPIVKSDEVELNDGTQVERRLLTHVEIDVDGTVINFYNTHLSLKDDFRAKEFGIIAEQLKNVPKAILTGDFNVDGYEEFETLAPLSYINNTETQYITFPSSKLKIDNIFYSSEFTENEEFQGILQNNHSDHVMLYTEFEFIPEK